MGNRKKRARKVKTVLLQALYEILIAVISAVIAEALLLLIFH